MTMNCADVELLLQARVDGECAPAEGEKVDAHLTGCAACREVDQELQALVGRLETMYAAHESEAPKLTVPGVPNSSAPGAGAAAKAAEELRASVAPTVVPGQVMAPHAADPTSDALVASGYRIEAPIARGGFGAVYRAVQLSLDRPVALKLLAPHLAHNPEFVARFLREAKVAAALNHPNLVAIFDVGQQGEQLYYAMELVEGEDVEVVLKRDGLVAPRRAVEITLGVARALAAASAAGIVHRDVKPANVLLTRQGQPKLADLGLAKALEGEGEEGKGSLTVSKKVIGSPNYMSPEQAQDIRKATPRSDVYSLGATLLHMVSGRVPFGTGSPVEVLARVLRDPPAIPEQLPTGEKLDPALRGILLRLLAKDPAARPDAMELVGALEAWLAGKATADPSLEETDEVVVTSSGQRMVSGRRGQSKKARRASDRAVNALESSGRLKVRRGGGGGRALFAAAAVVLGCVGLLIAFKESPKEPTVARDPAPSGEPRTAPESPRAPVKPVPKRVEPNEPREPARDTAKEADAERAIQDFERWMMANREETGERWRRAQELARAFPGTAGGTRAEKHRVAVETELARSLEESRSRADELESAEKLGEAREVLLAFLDKSGEEVPQGIQARVAVSALEAKLDVKLDGDLSQVEGLLAKGSVDEARALAAKVRSYADSGRAARVQEKIDAYLSARKPAEGPVADKGKTPAPTPPAGEKDPRVGEALALVQRAKIALERKDYGMVRESLKKLRDEYGKLPGIADEADAIMASLDKALTPPETGALLASLLHGKVKQLGGQRIEVSYGFEAESEAQDWVAAEAWGEGMGSLIHESLEEEVRPPSGLKEPWTVRKGTFAAYGWSRRRFVAPFKTSESVVIEVKAKGGQNVVVALQDPGKARSALFAANFQLDDLPLGEIGSRGMRRGAPEPAKRLQELKRLIEQTRKRGPSLAVLREDGFLNLDELDVQPGKMSTPAFTVELRPDGKDRHLAAVTVGKRTFPDVELEQGDGVWVTLVAYGAPVAWDEVTITGTVRDEMVQRLVDAAKQVGSEPEALRKKLGEDEDRRLKEEEERKNREEERRKREEEERRKRAGEGGDKKGEGDKKDERK